jgi:hypothetical protein
LRNPDIAKEMLNVKPVVLKTGGHPVFLAAIIAHPTESAPPKLH